mmetsp:Transcript_29849/g.54674  ORF Transcript_29849/g.54674 Transcript_29849/m.54674 type:complete len:265 (+) Transcript_29849:137-931(+)
MIFAPLDNAVFRLSHLSGAFFRDHDGVGELGGSSSVVGDDGPFVVLRWVTLSVSFGKGWLNGKDHARFQFNGVIVAKVFDKGSAMKFGSNAASTVTADHIVSVGIGHIINGGPNVCNVGTHRGRLPSSIQGLNVGLDQTPSRQHPKFLLIRLKFGAVGNAPPIVSGIKGFIKIGVDVREGVRNIVRPISHHDRRSIVSMHTSQEGTHVQAHHISLLKGIRVGNSLHHDVIDTDRHALGERRIIEPRRIRIVRHKRMIDGMTEFI